MILLHLLYAMSDKHLLFCFARLQFQGSDACRGQGAPGRRDAAGNREGLGLQVKLVTFLL
jgi:hypothetical protein